MTANFHALAQIPKETPYSKNVNIIENFVLWLYFI